MNSAIPPACMDRYINRYVGPPHPVQQQQHPPPQQHPAHQQQQLLSQNGFYPHQQLLQQQQQAQQQHQQLSHGPPPPNFMVGCYSNASGWTGVPLISTAARRPRKFPPVVQNGPPPGSHYQPNGKQPDFDENAMSRLALHAHGAPLILANNNNNNRYNRSNVSSKPGPNKPNKVPSNHAPSRDDHLHHLKMVQAMGHQQQQQQQQQQMSHPNDAHSVASDESGPNSGTSASSSSSSSDTCLPRIIKPRKRRKKDRKPAPQAQADPSPSSTASSQAPQHPAVNQLLLDETTRDFLHEIALMANAGTFDFAGLIRDQQQQQQQPIQLPQPPLQQPQQHLSDSSDSGINNLACSCRLCDPFCKIWAFPLRRSCSDNSAEIELNRAKDVGVIGSNRSNSFRSEWRSSPHSLEQQPDASPGSRKGSFSDSGDSGCDLLSGLTFCSEDILSSVNRELFLTPVDAGKEFKFPTSSGGSGGGGPNSISGSGSPNSSESPSSEMLLISELTKKLNEGLDLRSSGSDSGGSSASFSDSSVFGENPSSSSPPATNSGDLFVNFDAISRNNLFSVNNISKLSNLLFEDSLTAPGLVINSVQHQRLNQAAAPGVNYIRNGQNPPPPPPPSTEQRPFLFDTSDHMVWSNNGSSSNVADRKLLPVEE